MNNQLPPGKLSNISVITLATGHTMLLNHQTIMVSAVHFTSTEVNYFAVYLKKQI